MGVGGERRRLTPEACGEPVRQPRDRLTGQPEERQHSARVAGRNRSWVIEIARPNGGERTTLDIDEKGRI